MCITDLDKVNLVKLGYGGFLKPISTTAPAASKNDARCKSG